MNRGRSRAVAAREDGYVAALIAQRPREFLDDGCLARAADGEIADGDNLHPECRVAQDADIVKEAAAFDEDLEELGADQGKRAHRRLNGSLPFFENDLQQESLKVFDPDTKPFTHLFSVCQASAPRARGRPVARGRKRIREWSAGHRSATLENCAC